VTSAGTNYCQLVDGGVRNISPLGDVIDYDPDEVVIINCNSEDFQPYSDPAKNMLKIAVRVLTEITINEIFRQDMREFLHINGIISQLPPGVEVRRTDGTVYKKYQSILIEPGYDLGDALDFSRDKIHLHIKEGYRTAQKAYELYKANDFGMK
jgi:NTE family protein